MRINVYTEELLTANDALPFAEIVTADYVSSRTGEQMTNYGLRIFLKSPPELHYIPGRDDDRSAVTFWCGPSKENVFEFIYRIYGQVSKEPSFTERLVKRPGCAPLLERTSTLVGPRHRDDYGRMIPCLDYHDGKCQSLTHYCEDCPDRGVVSKFTGTGPSLDRDKLREQDTFGGPRPTHRSVDGWPAK